METLAVKGVRQKRTRDSEPYVKSLGVCMFVICKQASSDKVVLSNIATMGVWTSLNIPGNINNEYQYEEGENGRRPSVSGRIY